MPLKLATWNINSVRLRMDLVRHFVKRHNPDVLCLQETKVADGSFPLKDLQAMGFEHIAIKGQKGYHGVATASRIPFKKSSSRDFCEVGDARHVAVTLENGVTVHNFYVPAGGDEPDPEINDKFDHKLRFMKEMTQWFGKHRGKSTNPMILVGDLNVAPSEYDVWSHKQLLKVVSHTPIEVEHLADVQASHQWVDVVRSHMPEPEKLYSWWSYRARDWAKADRGRRLDHIWVTPALDGAAQSVEILREARGWTRPSDHVPVIATFDL